MTRCVQRRWFLPVFSLAALTAAWGGVLVENDFSAVDPDLQWQLNTNDPAHPIVWHPLGAPCCARLTADGDVGRAVSMILDADPSGAPAGPWNNITKFEAEFTFRIEPDDLGWGKADGLTFFFASAPLAYLGNSGGAMGWGGPGNNFSGVAVEIDTWRDGDEDYENWGENHIGVSYFMNGLGDNTPKSAFVVNPRNLGFSSDLEEAAGAIPCFEFRYRARLVFEAGEFELYLAYEDPFGAPLIGPVLILQGRFPAYVPMNGARPGFTAATGGATNNYFIYSVRVATASWTPVTLAPLPWAINAGGANYTDPYGTEWITDWILQLNHPMGVRTGGYYSGWGRMPVYNSNSDRMCNSERWAPSSWAINTGPGLYSVILHFNEYATAGVQRVQDVTIEGKLELDDFCPVRAAGGMYIESQRAFEATVSAPDNILDIVFDPTPGSPDGSPKISGIQVFAGGFAKDVLPVAVGDRRGVSNGYGAIDTNGFVKTWLLLGPYDQPDGAAPPVPDMGLDYLSDGGPITENLVAIGAVGVVDGMTVYTDYMGAAFSEGLYAQTRSDMNPSYPAPSWFLWVDDDGLIDYNMVHEPDVDYAMSYAVAYVGYDGRLTNGDDLPVTIGVSSDDSIQVRVNGNPTTPPLTISAARGCGGAPFVVDRGDTVLRPGMNVIMTKVFDGESGFCFRLRLEELGTQRPLTADDGISIHTDIGAPIVKMDASKLRIKEGDTVNFTLSILFGGPPSSPPAWDFNACDGLFIDATGMAVAHTFSGDVPKDRTYVVTACVVVGGQLTTVEKRIVVAEPDLIDDFTGATWSNDLWLDEPFHLGRGLEGAIIGLDGLGHLKFELPPGVDYDSWNGFDYMPKLLEPVPQYADWAITTTMTLEWRYPNNQVHAGLVAILDETEWIARPDYLMYGINRDDVRMEQSGSLQGTPVTPPGWTVGTLPYTVSLLMMKKSNEYTFYWRESAADAWHHQLTLNYGKGARQIGLFAKNWGLTGAVVSFDRLAKTSGIPPAVTHLTTVQRAGIEILDLRWTIPAGTTYDKISILRNGELRANLGGSATSYADDISTLVNPPDYTIATYEVRGFVGIAFGATVGTAGLVAPDTLVFQDGLFPSPAYTGTQDAHIIVWQSDQYDDAAPHLYNTGAHDYIEEGDWNGGHGDHKEILIQFDLCPTAIPQIGPGSTITEASLELWYGFPRDDGNVDHQSYAIPLLKDWNEGRGVGVDGSEALRDEVTWRYANTGDPPLPGADTAPGAVTWDVTSAIWNPPCDYPIDQRGGAYGPTDMDDTKAELSNESYGAVDAAGNDIQKWVTWDITAIVQAWADAPTKNFGVKITQGKPHEPCFDYVDGAYDFFSSNHAAVELRPRLVVKGDFVPCVVPVWFIRGDANGDGKVDIADPIFVLSYLFASGPSPRCDDAADANNDEKLDIADAIAILSYLFGGTGPLPEPSEPPAWSGIVGAPPCGPDSAGGPPLLPLGCTNSPPCNPHP